MEDIKDKQDIKLLIDSFYDKVKADDTIGFIFNEIIGDDWSHHLPVMYQFWDMVLFSKPGYAGNPTRRHLDINSKIPLKKEHFDRWLRLWNENADRLFAGEITELAKHRAMLMANLINMKVDMAQHGNLIQ